MGCAAPRVPLVLRTVTCSLRAARRRYDSAAGPRAAMGVLAEAVQQSVKDPNFVVVIHDFADAASAEVRACGWGFRLRDRAQRIGS